MRRFEFKIKSPLRDISKLGEAIDTMKGIVREFRELTSDFAAIANLRFVEPEGLSGIPQEHPGKRRRLCRRRIVKKTPLILIAAFWLFQSAGAHAAGVYQMDVFPDWDDLLLRIARDYGYG